LRSRSISGAAESLRGFISEFGSGFITQEFDAMHRVAHAHRESLTNH
jgi:hypothetical protein